MAQQAHSLFTSWFKLKLPIPGAHTGIWRKTLFISLLVFAELHNVAEAKVLAHMDTGLLPVKRGKWTDKDGSVVMLALDPAGKRAFHQIYHGVPPFFECSQCPH